MSYPLRNLLIDWDFDRESKSCYFNPIQSGLGTDLYISLYRDNLPFFEICSICDTNVVLYESFIGSSLLLDDVCLPFVYIKNLGPKNLTINFAHTGQTGCFLFNSGKINENFASQNCKYYLKDKESIILNFNVSADGACYYSEACYPFGFYYEFSGLKDLTTQTFKTFCYLNTTDLSLSTFSYDDFCLPSGFLDESCNNLNITNYGAGYLINCSPYQNKPSYKFNGYEENILTDSKAIFINSYGTLCTPSGYKDYLGNSDFTIEFFAKTNCIVADPDLNMFFGFGGDADNPNQIWVGINVESGILFAHNGLTLSGSAIDFCKWNHFAITREVDLRSLWLNGCLVCSGTSSDNPVGCCYFTIGGQDAGNRLRPFNGCISNFRIITGQALYTGCSYEVPSSRLDEYGTEYKPQDITGKVTFLHFTNQDYGPSNFATGYGYPWSAGTGTLCFISGDPFPTQKISAPSFWSVSTGEKEKFLLTGKCFTIEAIINPLSGNGSIISHGGCETGWGESGSHFDLYLESCKLNFDWKNTGCLINSGKNFISVDLTGSPNWSGFANWNYIALSANGSYLNLWINGNSECCKAITSDDFDTVCGPASFKIGSSPSMENYLSAAISNLRFINNCFICDPSCSIISNPINCTDYKNYWIETGNSSLLINLNRLYLSGCDKYKSFYFNNSVNNGVPLCLSFSGINSLITTSLSGISKYGGNCFESEIKINNVTISPSNADAFKISGSSFYCNFLNTNIESDCNICILYNICYFKNKIYNYCYTRSGYPFDSNQCIKNDVTSCLLLFDNCCLICENTGYLLSYCSLDPFSLNFTTSQDYSLKDLFSRDFSRCNLFFPSVLEFPYVHCYKLGDINRKYQRSISGSWINCSGSLCLDPFINFTNIIPTSGVDYNLYKSDIYRIKVDASENRYSTNNIQSKNQNSESEYYEILFDKDQASFFYSGLEFRYYPVCSVYFNNQIYPINNNCVPITLDLSGKTTTLDFPLRALSLEKLKIISDYETIERVLNTNLRLTYSNFNFDFVCSNSNYSEFIFPKLRNSNLTGLESPNAALCFSSCINIQSNLNFYLNPFGGIKNDKNYGLNNLMFFIASELNCGLVHCCNYSGFSYEDSNYNFLMIDLQNEFFDCCFSLPSGSGSFLIDQRVSFLNLNTCNPIPFKTSGAALYNYIIPIQTGFIFCDSGILIESGSGYFSDVCFNGLIKNSFTGKFYSGGATGVCDLIDISGNLTGSCTGFLQNSFVYLNENTYLICIPSINIDQTSGERLLSFNKYYTYSGIQPICIYSNYPLAEIKEPLIQTNLKKYSSIGLSGPQSQVYYYSYNINNPTQSQLKFLSPDLTDIEYILFSDSNSEGKYICFSDSESEFGVLQRNAASIKYNIKNLFSNNLFSYCVSPKHFVCINIIGDL